MYGDVSRVGLAVPALQLYLGLVEEGGKGKGESPAQKVQEF